MLVAIAVLLPLLGLRDKTIFLCARGEHYWTTLVIFVLTADFVPGAKGLHAALWFWAGVSKLNHHFPSVVAVMMSNSPWLRSSFVRRLMYRSYPVDLAPSRLAAWMSAGGTLLELGVPVLLLIGRGGAVTVVGLVLMLMLHGFITSKVPMGVPLEWNLMMVYGGVLVVMCAVVPLLGNIFPSRIPFLLAMRYYAGNWAYSIWLFRHGAQAKLERLTKSSAWTYDQLARIYDHPTCVGLMGKAMAFRLMHLHGRVLPDLVPRAVADLNEYEWMDGELMAGMLLGWNFGDGHLHREQLLAAVQEQCLFDAGELRCIMVEAQPLGDARAGLVEQGHADVRALRARPWPNGAGRQHMP